MKNVFISNDLGFKKPSLMNLGIKRTVISSLVKNFFSRKLGITFLLIFLGLHLISCGDSDTELVEGSEFDDTDSFKEFSNFPDKQFLDLELGMNFEEANEILEAHNFKIQYEDDAKYYLRESDSIEVIFMEDEPIYEITIFIKNKHYLTRNKELYAFLSEKTSKTNKKEEFTIFDFSELSEPFKLKYFMHKDFIRMVFALN